MLGNLEAQGQIRFRFGRREQIVLYKKKDETARHLLMKAAAYALFHRDHEGLEFDTKLRFKFPGDLVAVDATGEPTYWVIVDDLNLTRLEYSCRHVHAPVVLLLQEPDLDAVVAVIRRNVHYKYTHRHLTLYNFVMPVEDWLDPEMVTIPDASYDVFHF